MKLVVTLALAAAFAATASAQNSRMPSVEDIVRQLSTPALTPDMLRNNAIAVEGRRESASEPPSQSINLEVNFEYASSTLTPDARIVLDNLGRALADAALRDSRFRIAGHTDARGGDAYNLMLSRQRARAVADYLVRQHGIDARRLTVEGFGRSRLLDSANPESAVNRRVQVTNLGS